MTVASTSQAVPREYRLDTIQIQRYLPHRSPFLLIDRVLEIHPKGAHEFDHSVGTQVVALKNVTVNEPFFQGHFPGLPIMPGVLILEAMAQTACFAAYPSATRGGEVPENKDSKFFLVGVDNARFRRPVVPGDTLRIETTVSRARGRLFAFDCVVTVDGQRVAEAEIMANLSSEEKS